MGEPALRSATNLSLVLGPILMFQGRRLRRTIPRLPEASGPCTGLVSGASPTLTSPPLKLLLIGESTAAGVGAARAGLGSARALRLSTCRLRSGAAHGALSCASPTAAGSAGAACTLKSGAKPGGRSRWLRASGAIRYCRKTARQYTTHDGLSHRIRSFLKCSP